MYCVRVVDSLLFIVRSPTRGYLRTRLPNVTKPKIELRIRIYPHKGRMHVQLGDTVQNSYLDVVGEALGSVFKVNAYF